MPIYKPKPFRIAMIPTSNAGVNYYRMATWAYEMRKYKGVEVALYRFSYDMIDPHPWQQEMARDPQIRHEINSLCAAADVVIWQAVHYPHTLEFFHEMQHRHGKFTIVETDDNYVDLPVWNEAFRSFAPGSPYRRNSIDCMRSADAVIVSTPYLRDHYRQFNENIHIIENSLDFAGVKGFVGWDEAIPRRHSGLRIGWIGGRSHFNDIDEVAPILKVILQKNRDVELVLVNSAFRQSCESLKVPYPFEGMKNVREADRSVSINRYAAFAASFGFDIGIAPLVDCGFNRAKSNLRWLEYSAMNIPTISSNVGHFQQTIRHGEDGFLAASPWEWQKCLGSLMNSPELRSSIGRQAGKRVRNDFNVRRNAASYIRLLKKLVNTNFTKEDLWISPTSKVLSAT